MVNENQSQPPGDFSELVAPDSPALIRLPPILIDGVEYPLVPTREGEPGSWDIVDQGSVLEVRWTGGIEEMGHYQSRPFNDKHAYLVQGLDVSSPPYLRLPPKWDAVAIAAINLAEPIYFLRFLSTTGGIQWLYIANGARVFKVKLSDRTLQNTRVFAGTAGRPALHNGNIFFPFGTGQSAQKLTTSTADATNDTYTALTDAAQHYAAPFMDPDSHVARIARVHSGNKVTLSATGADGSWGADFEIGDSGVTIGDAHIWAGELALLKRDSVWRMDPDGVAVIQANFGGRFNNTLSLFAHMARVEGPLLFVPHVSGLYRMTKDRTRNVGVERIKGYLDVALDSQAVFPNGFNWISIDMFGYWVYATFGTHTFYGEYQPDDGTIRWLGAPYTNTTGIAAAFVSDSQSGTVAPDLVIAEDGVGLRIIRLAADGSLRTRIAGTDRGMSNQTGRFISPRLHMGEQIGQDLSDVRKLVSRLWVDVEEVGASPSNVNTQLWAFLDGAGASTVFGATASGTGIFEGHEAVLGTGLFKTIQMQMYVGTGAGYTAAVGLDPRHVSWGLQAFTPSVYRAVIDLTPAGLAGFGGDWQGRLLALRLLKDRLTNPTSGAVILARAPGERTTFRTYIKSVVEHGVPQHDQQVSYQLEVYLERFEWPAS